MPLSAVVERLWHAATHGLGTLCHTRTQKSQGGIRARIRVGEGRQPPLGTKTLRNQDRSYLMQHSEKIQKLMQKPHDEQNIKILNKNRPVVWILPFASGPYVTLYGTLPAPSFK